MRRTVDKESKLVGKRERERESEKRGGGLCKRE